MFSLSFHRFCVPERCRRQQTLIVIQKRRKPYQNASAQETSAVGRLGYFEDKANRTRCPNNEYTKLMKPSNGSSKV
ncbi:unnamed protein product [Larinioides sclopetarius]|uniref:Uncharacterized protein n=1 Tax=Larinioides sclopetarius TaxID=280406 RepID=A0AAV1ZUC9_9ARAC